MDYLRPITELVDLLGDWATTSEPLYRALAGALCRAIRAGDFHAGERLPSERQLASRLAISRGTVVAAYDHLREQGVLESRRGSGTRITRRYPSPRPSSQVRVRGGQATAIYQRLVEPPGDVISLAFAVGPYTPELTDSLLDLVRHDLPELLLDIGYRPRGLPGLCDAIATHFAASGLPTARDQVVVTSGAQQAIGLIAQMYVRKGAVVVVESPSWPGCIDLFRAAGARLVGVPLDAEGVRLDGVAEAVAEHAPALLYLMPTYHNPTGTLMSANRRLRIAELAAAHGVPVVEDNAYCTSSTHKQLPPPIAAFARTAEILTIGSLAKAVWGGLRIGWVRAPTEIAQRIAREKALADLGNPVIEQALAARLLPRLRDLAAARSATMRHRLDHLQRLLTQHLPSWRFRIPDGGSALWIELPNTDTRIFAQVALRRGVEVVPGAAMDPIGAPTGGYENYIRFPYTFSPAMLTEIVRRLTRAWADFQRHGPPPRGDLSPQSGSASKPSRPRR